MSIYAQIKSLASGQSITVSEADLLKEFNTVDLARMVAEAEGCKLRDNRPAPTYTITKI
jgi:hypothetical protein